ncbi:GAF domain-containing protein [Phormidesmis priestleyi]|uniref:GAF domain-containing sensor histidine kinase n=1 Tax=Phormidesmis priestleyi TaxID=268141 RepID=UPI00083AC8D2|nr:GAF domain-containing protein [Phormidesmis priestleyi]
MQHPQDGQAILTQEVLLHRITTRIRQSLELQEILSTTVAEVRSYLGAHRVKIYQFSPDAHGIVIAESIQDDRLPSLLGLNFPADDIPPSARELYVRARQRSVVDLTSHEIGISSLNCPETGNLLESQDIRYRPVDPCHVEYLTAMGVKSSVVVPIVPEIRETGRHQPPSLGSSAQLWGLLVSHHADPRVVTEEELQFIQAVVDQVSVAIAQSILLKQVREQAQQQALINQVTALLYTSPTVQLQAALEEAVSAFQGASGRLYLLPDSDQISELYTCGEQPRHLEGNRAIEENRLWHQYLFSVINHQPDGTKPWSVEWMRSIYNLKEPPQDFSSDFNGWVINDLYKEPLLRTLAPYFQNTQIRGLMIIPLRYGAEVLGCLTLCRNEVNTEILWAGSHDPDTRQLMARQSFETWQQLKTGQAQPWTEGETKLAQALGERFSNAVKQYRLNQQVQALNSNLEQQVQTRTQELQQSNTKLHKSTAELQQAFDRQQTLSKIITRIRESLELDMIFRAIATEVRQVLDADRVVVYRFYSETDCQGGETVAEDVLPEFSTTLNVEIADRCNSEGFLRNYRQGMIHVVPDVYKSGCDECYLQMLEQFQVKANLVLPLFRQDHLWGLLCIHQCRESRHWQPSEIEFIVQISQQLGIALQHATLLNQYRDQAQNLSTALDYLKHTQSLLIQSEKMSSLGQLVAGIAHEINNPVNFIYGNLTYMGEYLNNVLELLYLYQEDYPEPPEAIRQQAEATDLDFVVKDLPRLFSSLKVGAERIREIVLSLRNFSRLDQAEVKFVNIHEGIDSTLMILQHRTKASSGRGEIEILKHYGELPLVECFAGQLNQVLMNLIANAIDTIQDQHDRQIASGLAPTPGVITLATQQTNDDWIQISVKDTGCGILDDVKPKIFDPFFTTKPIGSGTGLGLSISYQIIEKHSGKLWCQSQLEEGSEFVIEIPIKQVMPDQTLSKPSTV